MPIQQMELVDSQFFIPPMLLSSLIHYAEQQQWSYQSWFENSHLNTDQIINNQGFVHFSDICNVFQHAIHDTQQPNLGLLLGSNEGQVAMGILGFAMQACKNVAEAMQTALHYHPISGSVLDLAVHIQTDYCEVEVFERYPNGALNSLNTVFCDEIFASMITCLNMMLGDHQELILLELSYDGSAYVEDYQRIFNCPIQFNSTRNLIRFNKNILSRTLKNYSPANYHTAIKICDSAFDQFKQINQPSLVKVLQHLIVNHLPERFDMQQAAQHFHLSERHLRRLLINEGANFQLIKQQVLADKAKNLLNENYTISEISYILGFSELREFRRAFKKWTGYSPTTYKQIESDKIQKEKN